MMKHRIDERCDAKDSLGTARASRACDHALAIANFCVHSVSCSDCTTLSPLGAPTCFGEGAEMCMRGACAPQNLLPRLSAGDGCS